MTKPKNTEAKYTPGEYWRLVEEDHGWILETGDGLAGDYIADFHKHVGGCADDERDRARAVLAAAAPELLERLQAGQQLIDWLMDHAELRPYLENTDGVWKRLCEEFDANGAALVKAGVR